MMCFKAIVLVSAVACLISAENKLLKERIFNCKLIPFKKHHSIFNNAVPSIIPSLPVDSGVHTEYTVPAEVTTLGTEPVPIPTAAVPAAPQQEVQYPPQQEVQYPPQTEVQYPAPQQEGQPPAIVPPQEMQNPTQQQSLYPPQHEGQRPVQQYVAQNPPSNEGLYPPQQSGQYYPSQNEGQYYPPQNEGLYYPPPNYQGFTNNNVPYNYPVYGQNVLRSVKSLDGQTYPFHQRPYRMFVRQPNAYYNAPHVYGLYAASQYNYVPQAPKTPQALLRGNAKST